MRPQNPKRNFTSNRSPHRIESKIMAERPVECSQCKKTIKVVYKEIVDDSTICTEMCAECPVLQAKLHGEPRQGERKESTLCCGTCGTPLEAVTRGEPLGCAECYAVFGDFLIGELIESQAIPSSSAKNFPPKDSKRSTSANPPTNPTISPSPPASAPTKPSTKP